MSCAQDREVSPPSVVPEPVEAPPRMNVREAEKPADEAKALAPAWRAVKDGALLVDVRSQGEWDDGHLEGAVLIPHDQVKSRIAEFGEDKARPIVVYCKVGGRAGMAESALKKAGFTSVINGGGYAELMKTKPE